MKGLIEEFLKFFPTISREESDSIENILKWPDEKKAAFFFAKRFFEEEEE